MESIHYFFNNLIKYMDYCVPFLGILHTLSKIAVLVVIKRKVKLKLTS